LKDIPAFPHTVEYKGSDCGGIVPHGGMTLRDYFAARAMQGMMVDVSDPACGYIAKQSYKVADAMMEARNGSQ
jgi:hypothetical protein